MLSFENRIALINKGLWPGCEYWHNQRFKMVTHPRLWTQSDSETEWALNDGIHQMRWPRLTTLDDLRINDEVMVIDKDCYNNMIGRVATVVRLYCDGKVGGQLEIQCFEPDYEGVPEGKETCNTQYVRASSLVNLTRPVTEKLIYNPKIQTDHGNQESSVLSTTQNNEVHRSDQQNTERTGTAFQYERGCFIAIAKRHLGNTTRARVLPSIFENGKVSRTVQYG